LKRRYKFLIWLAIIWALAIFPIWILVPDPHIASHNVEGALVGIAFVATLIGGLIWVVWPNNSN
jgi:hypothetical protein